MKKTILLIAAIVLGLGAIIGLTRVMDARRTDMSAQFAEDSLYVKAATAKRLSLGFNGLVADWYWLRTLQYVGHKIINYEQKTDGRVHFGNLSDLELRLLPSLLQVSTTLDPQFMAPYEYGAMILPEINSDQAIALLEAGIAANPTKWRLYQHLGYVYWTRHDYYKASEAYAGGAKLAGAPPWMAAMAARMKAEGGSREAAREMYRHLYDSSNDESVKEMVLKQLMRIDSLEQREGIRSLLDAYKVRNQRCASSWHDLSDVLRGQRFQLDENGAPRDPSGTPYRLIEKDCDVELDPKSAVPQR